MSDSTSVIDQLSTAQTNLPTRINEIHDGLSPALLYGRRAATTTGLTWGFYGGRYGGNAVANGTVSLTASTTNYVVALRSSGVVSVSTATTNWNDALYVRCYSIVAGASTITSYEDHRAGALGVSNYALPIAAAGTLGGVKVGSGLAIDGAGVLSASASAPGTQSLTDFANATGTTSGLTYGYQAGFIRADAVTTSVAAGTIALTANTTNYVEITGAGSVSTNTTGFTSGRYPMCTVLTGASTITTITDKRGVISVGSGVQLGGVNQYTKNQSVAAVSLTSGASIAVDASLSNNFKLVLGINATLANPTNLTDGMVLNIRVNQDGTGSRTMAYGTKYKWPGGTAPPLSTPANSVDLISAYYDSTDDTLACVMTKGFA